MNLKEEIDHYLAGLREPDIDDAAIVDQVKGYFGHSTVCDSDKRVLDKLRDRGLSGKCVGQEASGEESTFSGNEPLDLSEGFVSLEPSTHPASSSPGKTAPNTAKSAQHPGVHPIKNLPFRQRQIHTLDANHAAREKRVREMKLLTSSMNDDTIDIAADAELKIIQSYASATPSETGSSGEDAADYEKDSILTNEEEDQYLEPSAEVQGEKCRNKGGSCKIKRSGLEW